ncbi:hypothetical protein AB6A40_006450 [Gnathostoma spinigerum]|uniref:Uncharacterized protein n=1 Tax=Gnathostoma spinigerum TaxID=75299 RepID=A0ABD6EKI2_9BILA
MDVCQASSLSKVKESNEKRMDGGRESLAIIGANATRYGPLHVKSKQRVVRESRGEVNFDEEIIIFGGHKVCCPTRRPIEVLPQIDRRPLDDPSKEWPKTTEMVKIAENFIKLSRKTNLTQRIRSVGREQTFEEIRHYRHSRTNASQGHILQIIV